MDKNKIIEEVKSQMTGDRLKDYHFLKDKLDELAKNPETIDIARELSPLLMEVVRPDEVEAMKEKMSKEIKNREALFVKAENLYKDDKLETAKVVLDKILLQVKGYFEDDEVYHYVNIEEAFAFQIYTNLIYKGEKIIRLTPDHMYKYNYLHGVVCTKLGLLDEARASYEKALRWFPNSFSVQLELANIAMAKKELDKVAPIIAEAQKYCFVPSELARCFRAIGYYAFLIEDFRLALAGYLSSTIFDQKTDIKKELVLACQKLGYDSFKPLTPAESKVEVEKVGMVFGGNIEIVKMAVALSREFATRTNYQTAIYFMQIAYNLTHDEGLKKRLDSLIEMSKAN
ncbi:MAG: hypothetical protein IJV94_01265 [Bacilli bacterium]|nr:hypothetical protein [Bacilli bacterium]